MKQRRRVNGTDVTQPVPPRSGLVQRYAAEPLTKLKQFTGKFVVGSSGGLAIYRLRDTKFLLQL
jgi:hypothetical protein